MKDGAASGMPEHEHRSGDTSAKEDMANAGQLMMDAIDLVLKAGYKEAKSMIDMASKLVERVRENGK
jgi:hypothetical protein